MEIAVGEKTLSKLLADQSCITIPSFQRNYSWEKENVEQFVDDIFNCANGESAHFWGPVVFLREPEEINHYQLIDGQQRITTAVMMLALLRDAAFRLENRVMPPGLDNSPDLLQVFSSTLYITPLMIKPKFEASYLIDKFFQSHIYASPKSQKGKDRPEVGIRGKGLESKDKRATSELRAAYLFLAKKINERLKKHQDEDSIKLDLWSLYEALTSKFEIHSLVLNKEDDAYTLFETLNARGLTLNPSDLLKTLSLRKIKEVGNDQDVLEAIAEWDSMFENLGNYDLSKFLRHYLLAIRDEKIRASEIYKKFRELIEKYGSQGARKNLSELSTASSLYSQILSNTEHSDTELALGFERMNGYSETHRLFLLGMLQQNLDSQTQRKLTRALESLSFRWILKGQNAQELESHYQRIIRQLTSDPNSVDVVLAELKEVSPIDPMLDGSEWSTSVDLQKYLLRRIEETMNGAKHKWEKLNLEHLAPQNPKPKDNYWYEAVAEQDPKDEDARSYDNYCRAWGNVTLLEEKLNKSIQNSHWPQKVSGVSGFGITKSAFLINAEIKNCKKWTRVEIENRGEWLLECAKVLTGSKWIETGKCELPTLKLY
jgi:hypothetical protein